MSEQTGPGARGARIGRRGLLAGGGAVLGVGAVGTLGWQVAPGGLRRRVREPLGLVAEPFVPDAEEGRVRVERVDSSSMGEIELFTAVPTGYGDGAGLPVVVVLHGSSASASALRDFGLAQFVSAAVEAGTPPFVLVGTDDGPQGWVPAGGTDPQAMLREELPGWLGDRGWDADRRGLWGWSRGGYGALRLLQQDPAWTSGLALFSPALHPGDPVLGDLAPLGGLPWGLWCGEDDPFHDGALALVDTAPVPPDPFVEGPGGHTRVYWNEQTLPMLDWLVGQL